VSFAICSLYDFHVLKWNLVGKLVTVVILLYFAVQLAERDDPVGWPDHNTYGAAMTRGGGEPPWLSVGSCWQVDPCVAS